MISVDDDRFREPGSRYEREEPIAVAVVDASAVIDWSDAAHSPVGTLWLPETLFHQLALATGFIRVDVNKQTRLPAAECHALARELAALEAATPNADVRKAASLVRARAELVATSAANHLLLIEGP